VLFPFPLPHNHFPIPTSKVYKSKRVAFFMDKRKVKIVLGAILAGSLVAGALNYLMGFQNF